jgi:hypothetical protein
MTSAYDAAQKARVLQAAFPARSAETAAKHRARAVEALASHRCATDLTDGFCGPRDGKCQNPSFGGGTYRNCMIQAEGLMQAIESRGCTVVWAFDREMIGGSDG